LPIRSSRHFGHMWRDSPRRGPSSRVRRDIFDDIPIHDGVLRSRNAAVDGKSTGIGNRAFRDGHGPSGNRKVYATNRRSGCLRETLGRDIAFRISVKRSSSIAALIAPVCWKARTLNRLHERRRGPGVSRGMPCALRPLSTQARTRFAGERIDELRCIQT
jgi:hypothetical protein